jgi:hypothetical protein
MTTTPEETERTEQQSTASQVLSLSLFFAFFVLAE